MKYIRDLFAKSSFVKQNTVLCKKKRLRDFVYVLYVDEDSQSSRQF